MFASNDASAITEGTVTEQVKTEKRLDFLLKSFRKRVFCTLQAEHSVSGGNDVETLKIQAPRNVEV